MLDLQVTVEGNKVVIEGLGRLSHELLPGVMKGLERSAIGIHHEAFALLSGAGSKGISKEVKSRSGKTYLKWQKRSIPAGGYPVPVRVGHLRRMLDWLKPGETKEGEAGSFTAGPNEVIIYDSASYNKVIHEGLGSSAKYGPRRFLTDALERFNQGDRIKRNAEDEVRKIKEKAGFK
jgi:hypothetical protein